MCLEFVPVTPTISPFSDLCKEFLCEILHLGVSTALTCICGFDNIVL